jgi:hypothetical protein
MRHLNCRILPERFREYLGNVHLTPTNLKISLILIYFTLLAALSIILVTPPASSYEFSIYAPYPSYFWLFLIVSILFGQIYAMLCISNDTLKKYWILGFLAGVIAICLVLFLPMIRGYYIYGRADVLTHIGYMQDIGNIGSIAGDHYPGFHLLGFFMQELSGLPYGVITIMIPAIFSLIYVLYWFILGREITTNRLVITLLTLLSVLPMLIHGLYTPNSLANLLVPLVLFLMVKGFKNVRKSENFALFLVLSISMVFFHPLATLMIMLIFFLAYVYNLISPHSLSKPNTSHLLKTIAIVGVIFLSWSTYLVIFVEMTEPLVNSLIGSEISDSQFQNTYDIASSVDVGIISLIKVALYRYGIEGILGLCTLTCILYLVYLHINEKISLRRYYFLNFSSICFLIFSVLGITLFFTMDAFNWERIYRFALIFSLIVISYTVFIMYRRIQSSDQTKKIAFHSLTIIILIMIVYFSVFSFHFSPFMRKDHQQVTEGDYIGMHTFFEKRDPSLPILEYGVQQFRYHHSIYGTSIRNMRTGDSSPLDHFGYNRTYNLGSNYDEMRYFLLSEVGRGYYPNLYSDSPDTWRFTNRDFQMLESDVSTVQIYTNEHLDIYLVSPL